jgi:anthranilate phosphoribosyltransferase
LRGGDKRRNSELARKVLGGQPLSDQSQDIDAERIAAIRLSVAVNAAAALVALDAVSNPKGAATTPLVERINAFLPHTTQALEDSTAWNVMHRWIEVSRKVASSGQG